MYTDIFSVFLQVGLFTSAVVIYFIFFRKSTRNGCYGQAGWNYTLKLFVARLAVKRWKMKLPSTQLLDYPRPNQAEGYDSFNIKASAPDGSTIFLGICKLCGPKPIAEVQIFVKLADGTCYRLPESSETITCAWENVANSWSAGGLSIQVLEPQNRYRILFNGVLRRISDAAVRHVKFNAIWASATRAVKHPEDWSNELAAEFLAREPWGDGTWTEALVKCVSGVGRWSQFGVVQGRFIAHDEDGKIDQNEYLRVRGVKERSWALSRKGLKRSVTLAIATTDGTAVHLQGSLSHNNSTHAVDLFVKAEITGELKDAILSHLTMLREKAIEQKLGPDLRFAVRSSAVGEDSEALSAAGQNETVLGVTSDKDILRSILKCWASMFAFTSAYYRRQNGQPCYCGGAVVVQALVQARVAGVMFTRHPDAGDPTRILITANYGLGESVVSGSVEPDTVIIKRSADHKLAIASKQVGTKTQKIVSSVNGLETEQVLDNERNVSCLSESEMLKLAEIGIAQDDLWGAGRDIEWAISKSGIVYLLQARPITSLERWTEEELLHELDFPIMSDDELLTFANTGEVLPKPITALTYDMVLVPIERGVTGLIPNNGDGYDKSVVVTHNRTCLALYNTVYRRVPKEMDVNLRMVEISIHGHKVADDSILKTAFHRRQPKATDRLFSIISMVKNLIIAKKSMNDTLKRVPCMNIATLDNVHKMFNSIAEMEQEMSRYSLNHSITSAASSFTQFIAMSVLLEGKSDFSPEQCNEISTLLSSGDVLSAEVPQGLANLTQMLEDSGRNEEFRKQDPNTAMQWLKLNVPEVHEHVTTFLEQHGHRAIMEFDLSTKPWALVPEDLMKLLMQVVPNQESKETKTGEDIISSLKTPQKPNTRKALKWILPLCQRTVRYREATKAHLILAVHKLRLAAIHLGKLMVQNWYLPHYELVFYFRIHELKNYIDTRDPALLKKAMQRKQYYSNWSKLKFAEMNKGWVQPLSTEGPRIYSDGDKKLTGTSVCGGEVVARACVVRDLSEVDQLRQGDVLITHATDIGWSPYFPLLTGIVTELGGLISHGAVIAREYGLPCLVGVGEATDVFKTGDIVRLSGNEGLIEKVSIEVTADN
ncbi:putative phosphoenolpyruvate synthase [Zerene cesonia]|uniref:putative phosphoenolpyruvate synthase n=1 Tax=Zerene cesonia TaxID=33412 RepID=UPI0018E57C41|nr:putative phosphoenolpyruvate synthase [Zerene cesonia]